jgi:hypothetical protein
MISPDAKTMGVAWTRSTDIPANAKSDSVAQIAKSTSMSVRILLAKMAVPA